MLKLMIPPLSRIQPIEIQKIVLQSLLVSHWHEGDLDLRRSLISLLAKVQSSGMPSRFC